jgi:hypothetical protein
VWDALTVADWLKRPGCQNEQSAAFSMIFAKMATKSLQYEMARTGATA